MTTEQNTHQKNTIRNNLFSIFITRVPKNLMSFYVGKWLFHEFPQIISQLLIKAFARFYKINLFEAEKNIKEYSSIGDLFIRKLKPGMRPIGEGIVHPSDSTLTVFKKIEVGEKIQFGVTTPSAALYQAKGISFNLEDIFNDVEALKIFNKGTFLTYYLCPTDYHRVHSPVDGEIVKIKYIPGELWPVNEWSVVNVNNLFGINERIVVWIKTNGKMVGLIMVGATNVGKMTLGFDDEILTNTHPHHVTPVEKIYEKPIPIQRGDEVGIFHMGSTVIMFYENGLLEDLPSGEAYQVKMGESFSDLLS